MTGAINLHCFLICPLTTYNPQLLSLYNYTIFPILGLESTPHPLALHPSRAKYSLVLSIQSIVSIYDVRVDIQGLGLSLDTAPPHSQSTPLHKTPPCSFVIHYIFQFFISISTPFNLKFLYFCHSISAFFIGFIFFFFLFLSSI